MSKCFGVACGLWSESFCFVEFIYIIIHLHGEIIVDWIIWRASSICLAQMLSQAEGGKGERIRLQFDDADTARSPSETLGV